MLSNEQQDIIEILAVCFNQQSSKFDQNIFNADIGGNNIHQLVRYSKQYKDQGGNSFSVVIYTCSQRSLPQLIVNTVLGKIKNLIIILTQEDQQYQDIEQDHGIVRSIEEYKKQPIKFKCLIKNIKDCDGIREEELNDFNIIETDLATCNKEVLFETIMTQIIAITNSQKCQQLMLVEEDSDFEQLNTSRSKKSQNQVEELVWNEGVVQENKSKSSEDWAELNDMLETQAKECSRSEPDFIDSEQSFKRSQNQENLLVTKIQEKHKQSSNPALLLMQDIQFMQTFTIHFADEMQQDSNKRQQIRETICCPCIVF